MANTPMWRHSLCDRNIKICLPLLQRFVSFGFFIHPSAFCSSLHCTSIYSFAVCHITTVLLEPVDFYVSNWLTSSEIPISIHFLDMRRLIPLCELKERETVSLICQVDTCQSTLIVAKVTASSTINMNSWFEVLMLWRVSTKTKSYIIPYATVAIITTFSGSNHHNTVQMTDQTSDCRVNETGSSLTDNYGLESYFQARQFSYTLLLTKRLTVWRNLVSGSLMYDGDGCIRLKLNMGSVNSEGRIKIGVCFSREQ